MENQPAFRSKSLPGSNLDRRVQNQLGRPSESPGRSTIHTINESLDQQTRRQSFEEPARGWRDRLLSTDRFVLIELEIAQCFNISRQENWLISMTDTPTDDDLLDQSLTGDRTALGQLLLRYYDRLLWRLGCKMPASLRSLVQVEDILQQAFADAVRDMSKFQRREDGAFYAWLSTIADHRLQDTIKKYSRKKRGGDVKRVHRVQGETSSATIELVEMLSAEISSPSQIIARREATQALYIAMADLPEDYRKVVQLRFLEGKSLEETATEMDRTNAAVRSLIDRAKKKLRNRLIELSVHYSSH